MNQRRIPEGAAFISSQSALEARKLPGGFLGRSISRVAGHQCVLPGVGGVFYSPPKPARTSDPDCATKVAHKFPGGGLLMTRLRARVDNPVDGRSCVEQQSAERR